MWHDSNGVQLPDDQVTQAVQAACVLAMDTETSGMPSRWWRDYVGVVSLAWGPNRDQAVATRQVQTAIRLVQQSTCELVFHNCAFDLHFLQQVGFQPNWRRVQDTMIQSRILDNLAESHELKELGRRVLGIAPDERDALRDWLRTHREADYLDVPDDIMLPYAAQDAVLTWRLYDHFTPLIEDHADIYQREMGVRRLLWNSECHGIQLDVALLNAKLHEIQERKSDSVQKLYDLRGCEFNVQSNPQVARYLHDELGLPVLRRTPTGQPQVDEYSLIMASHPFADELLRYREANKAGEFLESYLQLMDDGDRIHPNINTLQARTSRMSSNEPNIQQVPIRDDPFKIREVFCAAEGWFVEADYDKQELRLAAELAGDSRLLDAIGAGRDVYREIAGGAFGVHPSAVTDEQRQAIKIAVLAINYGAGIEKLAFSLTKGTRRPFTAEQARQLREGFRRSYPDTARYFNSQSRLAQSTGQVVTPFGRRLLVDPQYGYKAYNCLIQGSAADETKLALLRMEPLVEHYGGHIVAPVHDSVLLWLPERPTRGFIGRLKAAMSHDTFTLPATTHVKYGLNWSSMID